MNQGRNLSYNLLNLGPIWKTRTHMEKCDPYEKVILIWKSRTHMEKWDTFGKVGPIWQMGLIGKPGPI